MYLRAMRDFTRCLGHSPDSATPEEMRAFQLDMKERGVGASTFNNRLTVLSFFFATTCPRPEMKRHTRRFQTETASMFEKRLATLRKDKESRKLPLMESPDYGPRSDAVLL